MTSKTYLTSTIQCFSAYLPAFVWAATIFILSSQSQLPGFTIIGYDYMFKKLAHISVYAVLYLLLHRGFERSHPNASLHSQWLVPCVLTLLYALTDELHQSFVPGRSATLRDIGYDTLGIGIAFLWKYKYL